MKYLIYKLRFTSPVRFGSDSFSFGLTGNSMTAYSDTLYSAIFQEWLTLFGEKDAEEFLDYCKSDQFLISDLMPYKNEKDGESYLYVPKPIVYLEKKERSTTQDTRENIKKQIKNINYIKVDYLDRYFKYLKNGGVFPFEKEEFGAVQLDTKVVKHRNEDPAPYVVSSFSFLPESGLYFICLLSDSFKEKFTQVVKSLGQRGIGGKKSSGYGKYTLREDEYEIGYDEQGLLGIYDSDYIMAEKLKEKQGRLLSLSFIYPDLEDIESIGEDDSYQMLQRQGFIFSDQYAENLVKRKSSIGFKQGSVFCKPLKGQILNLAITGKHKVYRYGKGLFLGGVPNE